MFKKKVPQSKEPAKPAKTPFGAQIFSMPERYQHGAEAKLVEPALPQKKLVQVVAPKPPPKKLPPKPPVMLKPKKKGGRKKLIIFGIIFLIVLVIGGWLLVKADEIQQTSEAEEEEIVSRPAPDIEEEEEEEVVEEEPEAEADPFAVEVTPGVDSDSDGLSDTEEKLVYDTDPRLPDSDSDGFLDGNEVFHRYNPNGTAPGTLELAGLAEAYLGDASGVSYSMLYPTAWDIDEGEDEVVIDADTGEGFRITSEEKDESELLSDWIEANVALKDAIEDTTKNGLDMIQSENQLWAYVDLGEAVLIVEYDTGIKTRVDYLQTFKMMLNSIEL
jgi:hypothetical protein